MPNPFNPSTTIRYDLPEAAHVRLTVFDGLGRRVSELVNGQEPAGQHKVVWNATSGMSGVYFFRLEAGAFVEMKGMSLTR
jgi:hypothetical protein